MSLNASLLLSPLSHQWNELHKYMTYECTTTRWQRTINKRFIGWIVLLNFALYESCLVTLNCETCGYLRILRWLLFTKEARLMSMNPLKIHVFLNKKKSLTKNHWPKNISERNLCQWKIFFSSYKYNLRTRFANMYIKVYIDMYIWKIPPQTIIIFKAYS